MDGRSRTTLYHRNIKERKHGAEDKRFTLTRAQGDRWEAIVPASLDGAFVVDLTAIDEAGNVGYTAKYIITIDLASLCVHIEPCPYYEELLEPEYYVELMGGCGCNDCTV